LDCDYRGQYGFEGALVLLEGALEGEDAYGYDGRSVVDHD
jgi:hypothetical protein